MKGTVFDIQRFAVHDGPGIRTLVFLKGCPLRCQWCSNPESQLLNNEIMFISNECIGVDKCGLCLNACEQHAIKNIDNSIILNRDLCIGCGKCAIECPCDALRSTNQLMSVDEVTENVIKDIDFYNSSGGGVTLSGGEPLFQYEFCLELLKSLKKQKLHVALETTIYCSWEKLKAILEYVDLFLIDIKHMDSFKHQQYTGVENSLILENLKKLIRKGANIQIRMPLIPEINDQSDNLVRTSEFIKDELGLRTIALLPYHRLGETKYEQLGKEYSLKSIKPINPFLNKEYFNKCKQTLEDNDISVSIGG